MYDFRKNFRKSFGNPINLVFVVSVLYWIYLILTSRMVIVYDATAYENLGKMIVDHGWVEFFKSGPNREPFYPALIAFSMSLGKVFGISYQFFQTIIQLLFLFLTQILTLRILKILKINNLLSALTILYLGISPAIVNSALSLFSEIATYPLILASMLLIYKSWLSFLGTKFRIILLAIVTSLLLVLIVLNKGIFEFVIPVFFVFFLSSAFFTRNRKVIFNVFVYLLVVIGFFYLLLFSYKSVNVIFNGSFTVSNRGAWSLYGSTARRMETLTKERFLTALAYVPGEGVCQSIFGEEKCRFWSFWKADELGSQKVSELSNMPSEAVDNTLVVLTKQKVMKNPGQYFLLFSVEASKMFFWESTQIGYVMYPKGLTKIFTWIPIKNGLRLIMAFLTLLSVIYLIVLFWRKRMDFLKLENPLIFLYFSLLFIFSSVGFYSIFIIIARYLLPIVPLYLIIIAYVIQDIYLSVFRNK